MKNLKKQINKILVNFLNDQHAKDIKSGKEEIVSSVRQKTPAKPQADAGTVSTDLDKTLDLVKSGQINQNKQRAEELRQQLDGLLGKSYYDHLPIKNRLT